jgi:hypothetical protein
MAKNKNRPPRPVVAGPDIQNVNPPVDKNIPKGSRVYWKSFRAAPLNDFTAPLLNIWPMNLIIPYIKNARDLLKNK